MRVSSSYEVLAAYTSSKLPKRNDPHAGCASRIPNKCNPTSIKAPENANAMPIPTLDNLELDHDSSEI